MRAKAKGQPLNTATRLVLTIVGALLMVAPPYALQMLKLTTSLQIAMIAAVLLASLVVGFVLLYLAFRGQESAS